MTTLTVVEFQQKMIQSAKYARFIIEIFRYWFLYFRNLIPIRIVSFKTRNFIGDPNFDGFDNLLRI